MKHTRFFLLAIAAAMIAACSEQNTPTFPSGGGGNSGGGTTPSAQTTAYFEYSMVGFSGVNITDKSTGKEAVYDFGDGEKKKISLPYNYLIFHSYEKVGTYTISVQATGSDGAIKTYSKQVVIKDPVTYITGIKYISVEKEYDYYKAKLVDDDIFTTTWFTTNYTSVMLYPSVLPFTYTFNKPIEMNGLADDDYYTLYIYHNSKASGNGTQCLKQNIYSQLFSSLIPYIEVKNNTGNTVVQLLLEYK